MGQLASTGIDQASLIVAKDFAATGQSTTALTGSGWGKSGGPRSHAPSGGSPGLTAPAAFFEGFNFAVWGTFAGTVALERSFDGGTTWLPVYYPGTTTAVSFTAPGNGSLFEPEYGVLYRWDCSAYASGTIHTRISQ